MHILSLCDCMTDARVLTSYRRECEKCTCCNACHVYTFGSVFSLSRFLICASQVIFSEGAGRNGRYTASMIKVLRSGLPRAFGNLGHFVNFPTRVQLGKITRRFVLQARKNSRRALGYFFRGRGIEFFFKTECSPPERKCERTLCCS